MFLGISVSSCVQMKGKISVTPCAVRRMTKSGRWKLR